MEEPKSAQIPGQDIEWQFKITYNAILSAATAALAVEGYRAARDSHHFRILESLGRTIGLNQDELDVLDNFRKKRNDSTYFGSEIISSVDATTIISMAAAIIPRVEKHLLNKLPDLKLIRP